MLPEAMPPVGSKVTLTIKQSYGTYEVKGTIKHYDWLKQGQMALLKYRQKYPNVYEYADIISCKVGWS